MKNARLILLPAAVLLTASCNLLGLKEEKAFIELHFKESPGFLSTKSGKEIPDTNLFILKVTDSGGTAVYEGKFGDCPEKLEVSPGSYTIDVVSSDFREPEFDSPQYGDSKLVVVNEGQTINICLECRQLNAGVRLNTSREFATAYPDGRLFLESQEGTLEYAYSERRIAYFHPGDISLVLDDNGRKATMMTRKLEQREILSIDLMINPDNSTGSQSLDLRLDTTRNWTNETIIFDEHGSGKGSDIKNAYSVNEAKQHTGEKGVWVYGYIVGGDLSASKISFTPPFSSNTNIAIASRSSVTEKSSCLSVQLPKGKIRESLNLVDNTELLGHQVFLQGDLVEAYFGIPGVQNLKNFEVK